MGKFMWNLFGVKFPKDFVYEVRNAAADDGGLANETKRIVCACKHAI